MCCALRAVRAVLRCVVLCAVYIHAVLRPVSGFFSMNNLPLAVRTSVSLEDPDAWVGESEPVVLSQMVQEENEWPFLQFSTLHLSRSCVPTVPGLYFFVSCQRLGETFPLSPSPLSLPALPDAMQSFACSCEKPLSHNIMSLVITVVHRDPHHLIVPLVTCLMEGTINREGIIQEVPMMLHTFDRLRPQL
jgi:hypothetical protein